jgi:hypothetical protein
MGINIVLAGILLVCDMQLGEGVALMVIVVCCLFARRRSRMREVNFLVHWLYVQKNIKKGEIGIRKLRYYQNLPRLLELGSA